MKLRIISVFCLIAFLSFTQSNEMQPRVSNFNSFSESKIENLEEWKSFNDQAHWSNPDFGILPEDAPCSNCVEILSKRKEDERFFVDLKDRTIVYQQKSLGALHYLENNIWRRIDTRIRHIGSGIYASTHQIDPTYINTSEGFTTIKTPYGNYHFNNWKLYGIADGEKVLLSEANWTNKTVGDDGVIVYNCFPGIDLKIEFFRGRIKSSFVVHHNNYQNYPILYFKDQITSDNGQAPFLQFEDETSSGRKISEITVKQGLIDALLINQAIVFPEGDEKNHSYVEYDLFENNYGIYIPQNFIQNSLNLGKNFIIDPTVTSTNTLAQASITGSGYNATCFNGFCAYNLTVPTPANATITNVQWSFVYRAYSPCYMREGANTFFLGTCRSPGNNNQFWYCNQAATGTCTGTNVSIFSDVSSCLPPPSCDPQNLNFTMRFHRCYSSGSGCSNACIGADAPWTMTITGRTLEYTNTTAITLSATTICAGQSITASTSSSFGVPGYTYNWSLSSSMSPSLGSTSSVTIPFPTAGSYTIYNTVTDQCGIVINSSRNITVNASPIVTANPNPQTICSGQGVGVTLTSSMSNTSYSWTVVQSGVTGASNGSGNGTGGSSTFNLNQTLTNSGTTPGTATYTITPTASGCAGAPITLVVTVNPIPTVTNPGNQTICAGQSSNAITFSGTIGATYNWSNNNTTTGLGANGSGDISAFVGQNSGTTNNVSNISVIPSFGTCNGTAQNFSITVTPLPTLNTVTSQTVCAGQPSTAVSFTGTALSYQWSNSNTAIGLGASGTGNIATFTTTNSTTNPITATISVTPVSGSCQGTPTTFTITVNPSPTVTAPQNQTICAGQSTTAITFSGSTGATFNWSNNNTATGLGASGTGDIASFVGTNSTTGPLTSTVTVTPSANGCNGTPVTFTITVNVTPTMTTPTSQTICAGQQSTAVTFSGTATTYSWSNSNTAIGLGATGTGNIAAFTTSNSTANPITSTISITPTSGTCQGTPTTFTITVNPSPTVTAPQNQTICAGQSTTAITFSGSAGATFNWSNNNTATGLGASGTGDIASFVGTNSTTGPLTSTVTVTPSANSCNGTPVTFTITVNVTPTMTTPTSQTICAGQQSTAVTFGGTATTYSWSNSNTAIGLGATGTGNIAAFTTSNSTANPITSTISITPTSGTCQGTPTTFTITVNPSPTVTAPQNQTICAGQSTTAITFSGSAGATFNWSNNNTATGLGASGTGDIASFVGTNSTTGPLTSTVTVTPSANSCNGTPVTFTITVNVTPTMTTPTSQTICAGQQSTAVTFGGTATTYSWSNSNTAIGLGATGTGNIAAFTTSNSTANPITSTISITPTSGTCQGTPTTFTITVNPSPTATVPQNQSICAGQSTTVVTFSGSAGATFNWSNNNTATGLGASGTGNIASFVGTNTTTGPLTSTVTVTPSANGCNGTPVTFTITVNVTPTMTTPTSQTICAGQQTTAVTFSGTATTYTWSNSNTTIGLGATGTGNIAAFTVTNTTTSPIVATISITPTSGTCQGTPTTFTITVNPGVNPTFNPIAPICQNAIPPALPTSSTNNPSITGTWSPSSISTTTVGTFSYNFTPGTNQCANPTTLSIQILPLITPTFNQIGPLCQNSSATLPMNSTNTPAISGNWNPSSINTSTSGSTTYTFTPNANQCASNATMIIQVNVIPTVSINPQSICSGQSISIIPTVNPNGGTYLWSNNSTASGITVSPTQTTTYSLLYSLNGCNATGSGIVNVTQNTTPTFTALGPYCQNTVADQLSNTSINSIQGTWNPSTINTSNPGTTTYTFTPNAGICATTATMNVTINPLIQTTFSQIAPLCQFGTAPTLPGSSNNNPPVNGTWSPNIVNTNLTGIGAYNFTPNSGQCASNFTMNIEVNPTPNPEASTSLIAGCVPLIVNLQTASIPGATYQWTANGINIGSTPTLNTTFNASGCYNVVVNVVLGSCSSTASIPNPICAEAAPTVFFTAFPSSFSSSTGNINFSPSNNNLASYFWDFGNGNTSTEISPTHSYTDINGNITVTLTATSALGCSGNYSLVLPYREQTLFYVPNSFTPDADEFNQTWGPIFTQGFDPYNFQLYIYNRWGELIWESKDAEGRWDGTYGINGTKAVAGVYLWKIEYKPTYTDEKNVISGHINLLR
jgi:gliding motility-associated-like protein